MLFVYFTELMILGFISLLLTIGQNYIVRICISEKIANKMLPCPHKYIGGDMKSNSKVEQSRKPVSFEGRYLSADTPSFKCSRKVAMFPFFLLFHLKMKLELYIS